MRSKRWRVWMGATALAATMTWNVAARGEQAPGAAEPQPDAGALEPGLAVDYYYAYFRWVDELVRLMGKTEPEPGEPLPLLDYRVGKAKVLTSKRDDGVGAHITGFIRLAEPGAYQFAVQSNDGVRLHIGGPKLIEEPDVHPDQWSDVKTVQAPVAGWYALEIFYFERKNTSTLRLYWKKPSDGEYDDLALVPAEAYAHLRR